MGDLLENEARHKEALPYLTIALQLDPHDTIAEYALFRLHFAQGEFAAARVIGEKLALAEPQNAKYHYALAQLYRKAGQAGLAERQLTMYRNLQQEDEQRLKFQSPTVFPD